MFSRELPKAIASGQFAFINRGDYPYATTHGDDVVEAVQCALERGAGGHAYFINDKERRSFRDFIAMFASTKNLTVDKLRSMPLRAVSLGYIGKTSISDGLRLYKNASSSGAECASA